MRYWTDKKLTHGYPCKLYKVTNVGNTCADQLTWGNNVTYEVRHDKPYFSCLDNYDKSMSWEDFSRIVSNGGVESKPQNQWFYAYAHPIMATIFNHRFKYPVMWEFEGDIQWIDESMEAYCTRLTSKKIIALPRIDSLSIVKFGIGCINKCFKDKVFEDWMLDFTIGRNRHHGRSEEIAKYCMGIVEKEQRKGFMSERAKAAHAAQFVCWAAYIYSNLNWIEEYKTAIPYYIKCAAMYSTLANSDINLLNIIETTMAAR
jgi:hypothetical protein